MTILNVFLLFINIFIVGAAYFILKAKFDRRYINKSVIDEVKREINSLIITLNETTLTNVSLIESKIQNIKELVSMADMKKEQLENRLKNFEKKELKTKERIKDDTVQEQPPPAAYTPQVVMKKSSVSQELLALIQMQEKAEEKLVDSQLEKLSVVERIKYLNGKGLSPEEIRKKLALDPGEFEFLVSIENINLKF